MRHWREILVPLLIAVPILVAVACGLAWLHGAGYLPHFLGAAAMAVIAAVLIARAPARPHGVAIAPAPDGPAAERAARAAVAAILADVGAADVGGIAPARELALRTVRAVAQAYHPGDPDGALYAFTVPELLLMSEDASRRLYRALDDFPLLRHVRVDTALLGARRARQAAKVWGWAGALRKLTPQGIVLGKVKDVVSKEVLSGLGNAAKARLAAVLVRELGETAIKLYSGEYRRAFARGAAPADTPPPAPGAITILFAGLGNAGKSTLLNALVGEARVPAGRGDPTETFFTVALESEAGSLVLIDSPGLDAGVGKAWLRTARLADLIIWVAAANRADRAADQRALAAVRGFAQDDPRLRETPLVLVLTHADLLNPPMAWAPPYDWMAGERPKERNIRDATTTAAAMLGFPSDRAVPVALAGIDDPPWNVAAVWARIHAALPEAKQKQLERGLRGDGWTHIAADTIKAAVRAALRG